MNNDYVIDMRVFSNVPQEEIGIIVPLDLLQNGKVPPGIHQMFWNTTERLLDEFLEKTFTHPDLKILGIHNIKS